MTNELCIPVHNIPPCPACVHFVCLLLCMCCTTQIDVSVLDANDNAPTFTRSTHRAAVPSNTSADVRLVAVRAFDADLGPDNNNVRGSF